jgi:hypothetical protein
MLTALNDIRLRPNLFLLFTPALNPPFGKLLTNL